MAKRLLEALPELAARSSALPAHFTRVARRAAPNARRTATTAPPRPKYLTRGQASAVAIFGSVTAFVAGLSLEAPGADRKASAAGTWVEPTRKGFEAAMRDIRASLAEDDITTEYEELELHGTSAWTYHNASELPGAILYPHSTEDVAAIVRACAKHSIPVVPYAGGTSLEGASRIHAAGLTSAGHTYAPSSKKHAAHDASQPLQPGNSVMIDFLHMDKIVKLNGPCSVLRTSSLALRTSLQLCAIRWRTSA